METMEVQFFTFGHPEDGFKEAFVPGVTMPRGQWLEMVETLVRDMAEVHGVNLTDELMPVAYAMDHFAMGTWINRDRGCGCLVGEYLVAADIISRRDAGSFSNRYAVQDAMEEKFDRLKVRALTDAGNRIDQRLRWWMGSLYPQPDVVVFTDD
jgi:hypothetical protein